jgi:hypothetical protein
MIPEKSHKSQRSPNIFVIALWLLVLATILLLGGCASSPSATFSNPKFPCPSSDVVEPDAGYPHPAQQYPPEPEIKSVAELKDFCARMKERFADSNMTIREAKEFYALLEKNNAKRLPDGNLLSFGNGSYGMPGLERLKPFVFEKQVSLKKITAEKYEIFYYFIGCGLNYTHEEILLEDGKIRQLTPIEIWSEMYPC